jgi:hypothetical protein
MSIRLVDYSDEIGVSNGNAFTWHLKTNVTVSASEDAVISLFDDGELILSANTEDFEIPKEASVKDLVLLIKKILSLPVDIEVPLEELITLEDIHEDLILSNELLLEIKKNSKILVNILQVLTEQNELIRQQF